MLESLRLVRFKGFRDCKIPLTETSVLVGANNAGKSTVVGAIRLVAALLPQARRREPPIVGISNGEPMRGWSVTGAAVEAASFTDENVRNDFGNAESRIEASFTSGAKFLVVWPEREDSSDNPLATCHVVPPLRGRRRFLRSVVQDLIPSIGVVPTLAPLDDRETMITDEALRRNLTSRRTSRYFRNALWRVWERGDEWSELEEFLLAHTPEIGGLELRRTTGPKVDELDLYYEEPGRRLQRELTWAGDGVQIWLQALFHIWRARSSTVVVLDEPDVYLHPDLQRRLARLTFSQGQQVILATHSIDVLAEAPTGSAVWIDRQRKTAERPKRAGTLAMLGRRLGSGLELGVARALRSRVAVFVEGHDMRLLAAIAQQLGADQVASAKDYATIPLGGFSRHQIAGAFAEVVAALGGDISVFLFLDRDLRSQEAVDTVVATSADQNVHVHVWLRRELENYLLDSDAIAATSGLSSEDAHDLLCDAIAAFEDETRTALMSQRLEERNQGLGGGRSISDKSVLVSSLVEFETLWMKPADRVSIVDAKAVIHRINGELQARRAKTLTARALASNLDPSVIGDDLRNELLSLEHKLTQATSR